MIPTCADPHGSCSAPRLDNFKEDMHISDRTRRCPYCEEYWRETLRNYCVRTTGRPSSVTGLDKA